MKFADSENAFEIPLELIEAQEEGNLVFFCGAGISYPAHLPGFLELVKRIFKTFWIDKDDEKYSLENKALKDGNLDQALHLLEQKFPRSQVRKEIIKELKIPSKANLSTHKALLELSKIDDNRYRLVTTNVDHGFIKAKGKERLKTDTAPLLPIPKRHKWHSIVHLHGLIDEVQDPDGENLVFTSGDFGSAYLTESWASRFITELFRQFKVLFVGYSLNDPILRYMTDTIAAEIQKGDLDFQRPYILVKMDKSPKEDSLVWEAKGVIPIFYTGHDKHDHSSLHITLEKWAEFCRDGLASKERLLREEAQIKPLIPFNESTQRVIDILKEKTHLERATGYFAQVFKELENPPAPIEWLPILVQEDLLSICDSKRQTVSISHDKKNHFTSVHEVTWHFWQWLCLHLEEPLLIEWVLQQGGYLHPDWATLIKKKIEGEKPLNEPYQTFWRIVTSGSLSNLRDQSRRYEASLALQALKKGPDNLSLNALLKILEPSFQIIRTIFKNEVGNFTLPFEVTIDLEHSFYQQNLRENPHYPNSFIEILFPVSNLLNKALQFWELLGIANEKNDPSHWEMLSIVPHSQNHHFSPWIILIELCRDLWDEAWQKNYSLAMLVLEHWKSFKYPAFRRLTFYAYTQMPIKKASEILAYLLEDDNYWLWSNTTKREMFRLLAHIGPHLPISAINHLVKAILIGPPRNDDTAGVSPKATKRDREYSIWLRLAKLKSFGVTLNRRAERKLEMLIKRYPDWKLAFDERDEFTHWMEVSYGQRVDITLESFKNLAIPEAILKLKEKKSPFYFGRLDLFQKLCQDEPKQALDYLTYFVEHQQWDENIWEPALIGLTISSNCLWNEVSTLLLKAELPFFGTKKYFIATWLKKASESIPAFSQAEANFWALAQKILEAAKDMEVHNTPNFLSIADNHPVGILTEAFFIRLHQLKLKQSSGIPHPDYLNFINSIMISTKTVLILGQVILATRLVYLYSIDPKWTQANLIPKFKWDKHSMAPAFWQGFLSGQRLTRDIAVSLKQDYLIALHKKDVELTDFKEHLYYLFTLILIDYPEIFTQEEKQQVFRQVNSLDLILVAKYLHHHLICIPEKKPSFWKNRIKPLFQAWPKENNRTPPECIFYFASICIMFDSSFEEVFNEINHWLIPIENTDFNRIIHLLNNTNLPNNHPVICLDFLYKIFPRQHIHFTNVIYSIMEKIENAKPELKKTKIFKEISVNFRKKKNLAY